MIRIEKMVKMCPDTVEVSLVCNGMHLEFTAYFEEPFPGIKIFNLTLPTETDNDLLDCSEYEQFRDLLVACNRGGHVTVPVDLIRAES